MLKSILSVSIFTVLSRILGFLRDMLQASLIGAGPLMDAIAIALRLPSFFRKIFAEGAFNASFVPLFSRLSVAEGRDSAHVFASMTFIVLLSALLFLVFIVELFMPQVVHLIAPGFVRTPERLQWTIEFSRITFPFLIMISINAFYSGILNSMDRFVAAAASPAVGNIGLLLMLWYFGRLLTTPAHALIWGVFVCGILQAGWVYIAARNAGFRFQWVRPTLSPSMKGLLVAMVPGALGAGISQINFFVDMVIASLLKEGGISFLYYADRLNQLPLSVIGTAMGTALLPVLSRKILAGEFKEAIYQQNQAMRYGLLLCMPAMLFLLFAAEPLVHVLFERGRFDHMATYQTACTLQAFVVGLPAYILIKIFSTTFFASRDTKTPVMIGGGAVISNIILVGFAYGLMDSGQAHVGIAYAAAGSAWLNAVGLAIVLSKRQLLVKDAYLLQSLRILMACTVAMSLALWGMMQYSPFVFGSGRLLQWGTLGLWALISCLAYGAVAAIGMLQGRPLFNKNKYSLR